MKNMQSILTGAAIGLAAINASAQGHSTHELGRNIQSDLANAGGQVLEQAVVVDGNLVTSRHPIDVAEFSTAVKDWLTAH